MQSASVQNESIYIIGDDRQLLCQMNVDLVFIKESGLMENFDKKLYMLSFQFQNTTEQLIAVGAMVA